MRWFRANIRGGSRLALFALTIQFLLSFGHFHPDSAQAAAVSVAATRSELQDSVGLSVARLNVLNKDSQAVASGPVRLRTSSGHVPAGQLGDDCAICAVMALVQATIAASAPPCLTAPQATGSLYLVADAGLVDLNSSRPAFQPRAPPVA